MASIITTVQPPLEFVPPAFNPWVLKASQVLIPYWRKWKTPFAEVQGYQLETLIDLYHQFLEKKIRLLIAFRHPNADDPLVLTELFWKLLPQAAKNQGRPLPEPVHFHFIYDRGIPLWAGNHTIWLFPRLGGSSILRGAIDRQGLKSARELFVNGNFPLAIAPEGATNGHNQCISPLEPGISQIGFWCVEDLKKAGRDEEVVIVPLGIQYFYINENWPALEQLLTQLETDCGLPPLVGSTHSTSVYKRLTRLGNYLLDLMENFYRQFYHRDIPNTESENLQTRLQRLLEIALGVAEDYFNLKPTGELTSRCRRLEQAGWEYIYRNDAKNPDNLSPVEKGLADRIAIEASIRMGHMRLVEGFVAVTGQYIRENPTFDRFVDTTMILWSMITRIKGGNPFRAPNLGKQRAKLTAGKPISVSQRWETYHSSRRKAVADLTQDLQHALEDLIIF